MATQISSTILSTAWTDITGGLSLSDGVEYIIQNISGRDIYLSEAASLPAANTTGHIIPAKEAWTATPESGLNLYVRALDGSAIIAVTEA